MKVNSYQNIRIFVLVLFILFSLQKSSAQYDDFWSNVRFGGNIGFGISGNTFSGVIAPSAVYDFNEFFSAGLGLNFGYTDGLNFTGTNYGGSIIALFNPIQEIQASAEFEQMGVSRTIDRDIPNLENYKENYWYPALFVGLGYRINFVSVGLRYDVLYDETKSIYANAYAPFVRVFF